MEIVQMAVSLRDIVRDLYLLLFRTEVFTQKIYERARTTREKAPHLAKSAEKLKGKILRGARATLYGIGIAHVLRWLIEDVLHGHVSHDSLTVIKLLSYSLILWGVLSPVGYGIRTFDGETLPEIFDEQWHKVLYWLGAFGLFLAYLLE